MSANRSHRIYYIVPRNEILTTPQTQYKEKSKDVIKQRIAHRGACDISWSKDGSKAILKWMTDLGAFIFPNSLGPYSCDEIHGVMQSDPDAWDTEDTPSMLLSGEGLFGVECDPINDVYNAFEIGKGEQYEFKLPVVVYGETKDAVYDQLFDAYTLDDKGDLDTYTARETTVSVDYTQEDADQTIADVQEITDGVMVRAIKHPDRDEWAMHVSTHIIVNATDGAKKDALMDKHLDKINNGKNKTKGQAKADGWK